MLTDIALRNLLVIIKNIAFAGLQLMVLWIGKVFKSLVGHFAGIVSANDLMNPCT
jgi:hypothetical protein